MKPLAMFVCLPLLLAACTVNSTNSGGGPSSGCNLDANVSCSHDSAGYSCAGNSIPQDSSSSLDCSDGTVEGSTTAYCCITLHQSTCAPDSSVQGCQSGSYGFSCTGSDTPDAADSSLNCSVGTPSGNAMLYCCT